MTIPITTTEARLLLEALRVYMGTPAFIADYPNPQRRTGFGAIVLAKLAEAAQ